MRVLGGVSTGGIVAAALAAAAAAAGSRRDGCRSISFKLPFPRRDRRHPWLTRTLAAKGASFAIRRPFRQPRHILQLTNLVTQHAHL